MTELDEKGPDVDVPRQLIRFVAQRLMDMDVEQRCGAGYVDESGARIDRHNGDLNRLGTRAPAAWNRGSRS